MDLLLTAVSSTGSLKPSLIENRVAIKDKLAAIKGFEGISGTLDMNVAGNPVKSAVVILINDKGEFESYKMVNP